MARGRPGLLVPARKARGFRAALPRGVTDITGLFRERLIARADRMATGASERRWERGRLGGAFTRQGRGLSSGCPRTPARGFRAAPQGLSSARPASERQWRSERWSERAGPPPKTGFRAALAGPAGGGPGASKRPPGASERQDPRGFRATHGAFGRQRLWALKRPAKQLGPAFQSVTNRTRGAHSLPPRERIRSDLDEWIDPSIPAHRARGSSECV